jgi:hypothetical protein
MSNIEFEAWPKTPRLFRDMIITEKIDGTNAAVIITEDLVNDENAVADVLLDGSFYQVGAQSRTRLITPGKSTDNFGFAAWVQANAKELVSLLGPGRHFGEWWGKGIQRGYGQTERHFSLFNVGRYGHLAEVTDLIRTVPVLYQGQFSTDTVLAAREVMIARGSVAAPGFDKPEGLVVYHAAARQVFKVMVENDDQPKGLDSASPA